MPTMTPDAPHATERDDTGATLTVTLPLLPTLNHAYQNVTRKTKTGKAFNARILTDDARSQMLTAGLIARNAAQLTGWRIPEKTPLCLTLRLYLPRGNHDGDNRIKLVQDTLADALGFNDKTIKEWHIYSAVDPKHPRCEVELRPQEAIER